MKAMILAAGLGTRLRPLTNDKPKALVEVHGKTLLEIAISRLSKAGFHEIVINVHHFADQIIDFIESKDRFGIQLTISDERDKLLETGGGIKKAAPFLNGDKAFLVCNVDIISDIDLSEMYHSHLRSGALATLAVRQRETSRYLLFNHHNNLSGWKNTKTEESIIVRNSQKKFKELAFSGIHIIQPSIFRYMNQEGKFSIIETYLDLAKKHKIKAYSHNEGYWLDVGKPEQLEKANALFSATPRIVDI